MRGHDRGRASLIAAAALAVVGAATATATARRPTSSERQLAAEVQEQAALGPAAAQPPGPPDHAGRLPGGVQELGATCEIVGNPSASTVRRAPEPALVDAALSRERRQRPSASTRATRRLYPFINSCSGKDLPVVSWHFPVPRGHRAGPDRDRPAASPTTTPGSRDGDRARSSAARARWRCHRGLFNTDREPRRQDVHRRR